MSFPAVPLLALPGLTAGGETDYPAESDVRDGVEYAFGAMTGTVVLPAADEVLSGVGYGAGGTEYTGTYECDCPEPPVPTGSIIPFALVAEAIVLRVAAALGTSTDWVRPVASDDYKVTETENLFAYVRFYGPSPVDPTTGEYYPDDGSGRYRRVVGRRVRVYLYTRTAEDAYGGDEVALLGADGTTAQNVTTPPVMPGHFVAEELVMNALDDWTPVYFDETAQRNKPYTVGPLHQIDDADGPPVRPPEEEAGLVRSHLDFQVCYKSAVQRTEPAPDGLPVPDHNN